MHSFNLNFQQRNENVVFMRTTNHKTTAERIKYFKLLKNMKRSDVCKHIGVSRNTYISYESNDRTSYPEGILNKLAECFGVGVEVLK